jgi:hypothetical protein
MAHGGITVIQNIYYLLMQFLDLEPIKVSLTFTKFIYII